jgi:opacity protein-like surface antigen
MENGNMLKNNLILILFMLSGLTSIFGQYESKVDIVLFKGLSTINDSRPEYVYFPEYRESYKGRAKSQGIRLSPSIFKSHKIRLGITLSESQFDDWKVNPNIDAVTSPLRKQAYLFSTALEFNYLPIINRRFEPFISLGISYFYFQSQQNSRTFSIERINIITDITKVDFNSTLLEWTEPGYDISLGSFGFIAGAGANFNLNQTFYLRGQFSYTLLRQKKSDHIPESFDNFSVSLGVGVKLFKTKSPFK